jgi:GNAT superfamily N-acetyltransferase
MSLTPLRPRSLAAIHGWWAEELGVNALELAAPAEGVSLSPSPNVPGILLFRRGGDLRIGAPMHKLKPIHEVLIGHPIPKFMTPEFWRKKLPEICGVGVGPALLHYLDAVPKTWTQTLPSRWLLRALGAADARAVAEFAETLSPIEREHSGVEFGSRALWGIFESRKLVAVAGSDPWPGRLAHIGVAVHPQRRGLKLGQFIVEAAARGSFARKRIVQYRTLADNAGSAGLARALGLEVFAETLYVRPPVVPAPSE